MQDRLWEGIKSREPAELTEVAKAIRERIIQVVSRKGGHLGANLGTVELTVALHYVFDLPADALVWDVGHQAYAHKLLSGRWEAFETNREFGGLSGFPKRGESEYDPFGTGHSSTALSAVIGLGLADRLLGETGRNYLAVVGDASLGGGMALEALNHLSSSEVPVLLVYNDNSIGIDPGVGALQESLERIVYGLGPDTPSPLELFDLEYRGPVDGHNLEELVGVLAELKGIGRPVFLHVRTIKGKGLAEAERSPIVYHAPGKFEPLTGKRIPSVESGPQARKFQEVFGQTLLELAENYTDVLGVTAAMPTGTSMKVLQEKYPQRVVDVGIAEQHAVTMAAGIAAGGAVPFCAIYSTFFQRAYDQLIHDVAIQNLKVVFCLDRAGLVGEDGPTHHGLFDIASLLPVPGITLCAPLDEEELSGLMHSAYLHAGGPVAIRYPRGRGFLPDYQPGLSELPWGKGRRMKSGSRYAILSYGTIGQEVAAMLETFGEAEAPAWYDLRFAKPLDEALLHEVFTVHAMVVCLEEGSEIGGVGSEVGRFADRYYPFVRYAHKGVPDQFVSHGPVEALRALCGLDAAGIREWLSEILPGPPDDPLELNGRGIRE